MGLEETWRSLRELAAQIPDATIDQPTRLPGWSIRDIYSHITASQLLLLGRPEEAPLIEPDPPHVRHAIGRKAEAHVALRRGRAPREVLDEFCSLSGEMTERLRAFTEAQLDGEQVSGVQLGEMLSIIQMDDWIHEQDIRVAAALPGHDSGPGCRTLTGPDASQDRWSSTRCPGFGDFLVGRDPRPPTGRAEDRRERRGRP